MEEQGAKSMLCNSVVLKNHNRWKYQQVLLDYCMQDLYYIS